MIILGLYGAFDWDGNESFGDTRSTWVHDSGCTLFMDGSHVCSISEERLTRVKYEGNFPYNSINYCLSVGNIKSVEVNLICIPSMCLPIFYEQWKFGKIEKKLKDIFPNAEIKVIGHHLCHASASIFTSGFDECDFLTLDGTGGLFYRETPLRMVGAEIYTIGSFDKNRKKLKIFTDSNVEYSTQLFGNFYSFCSIFSHCKIFNKEFSFDKDRESYPGKMMGLSAYGNHKKIDKEFFYLLDDIEYMPKILSYDDGMDNTFSLCSYNNVEDFVAWFQNQFEKYLLLFFEKLQQRKYLDKNICLGGGVFLNVIFNSILKKSNLFENIHIFPATTDSGLHFGAACYGNWLNDIEIKPIKNLALLGKEYENDDILESIKNHENISYKKLEEDVLLDEISDLLTDNKIVAWFQGKSEFGPRALGSRSILMDPRKKDNKSILNSRVKHREYWRPFASVIPTEKISDWVEEDFESEYMLYSYIVKNDKRSIIPAVTHVDNTCRMQTISDKNNLLYKLLCKFEEKTDVPILLNTSFNDNGEPIVETPNNALDSFLKMDIDYLVIGNYLVEKI